MTAVERTLVQVTPEDLAAALASSEPITTIHTSFVERQSGTDRTDPARKARKTRKFLEGLLAHVAVTGWVFLCDDVHHLHRGLRLRAADGAIVRCPLAMAGHHPCVESDDFEQS